EWKEAARTLKLVQKFIGGRGGAPRIEDSTGAGKLALGREALGLRRECPELTWADVADRLGMIRYDEDIDPVEHHKIVRAAAEKIRRWAARAAGQERIE